MATSSGRMRGAGETDETAAVRARAVETGVLDLGAHGFAVMQGLVADAMVRSLREEALRRDALGELVRAGVGKGAAGVHAATVRGDRTAWLDRADETVAEIAFRVLVEELRVAFNEALFLGLWTYEGHYALYPAGATYARHVDRHAGDDRRVLSMVLYLNDGWQPDDGGALRLHLSHGAPRDVLPIGGTVVAFLSDAFSHEVLAATRPRIAISGWLKRS